MFYQDFDAAIKNASGKKNFAQRATTAFNMAAKTFGTIGVCSLTLFGIGISSMSGTSTILLAATSIIASASSWGLSHFSSAYAKEVSYEIKYFNEKKALQEQIESLTSRLLSIEESIVKEQKEQDQICNDTIKEIESTAKPIKDNLEAIQLRIREINEELTMSR